ncbi:hypothetical protein TorRG33x02_333890 [Trema orientale]|uniref:Uncharacterized protein n=1 Tax=Trema orientale TaxID=63057 RepID=A0A2P5B3N9_TREOI|nr:hypothetical protein TorRG33x02_333890 [Trema orientale]
MNPDRWGKGKIKALRNMEDDGGVWVLVNVLTVADPDRVISLDSGHPLGVMFVVVKEKPNNVEALPEHSKLNIDFQYTAAYFRVQV